MAAAGPAGRSLPRPAERRRAQREGGDPAARDWGRALAGFEARRHWHCHFLQELESGPRIEFEHLQAATAPMRPPTADADRLARWPRGEAGWPPVDACMRHLAHHGWPKLRMHAMLMALAGYQLWLQWRGARQQVRHCSQRCRRESRRRG